MNQRLELQRTDVCKRTTAYLGVHELYLCEDEDKISR